MTDKAAPSATETPESDEVCRRHTQKDGTWYLSGCNDLSSLARRLERERNRAYYLQAEQRERAINAERERDDAKGSLNFHINKQLETQAELADARHQQHLAMVFAETQRKEFEAEIAKLREVITDAQGILARYIIPDSGITDFQCVNDLLGLLDGAKCRAAIDAARKGRG
jgi:hypothetical protein